MLFEVEPEGLKISSVSTLFLNEIRSDFRTGTCTRKLYAASSSQSVPQRKRLAFTFVFVSTVYRGTCWAATINLKGTENVKNEQSFQVFVLLLWWSHWPMCEMCFSG